MNGPITWAARGSTITGRVRDDIVAPYMMLSRCDALVVAWWCESHREECPTLEHMLVHLDAVAGPHHLAIACPRHGYEAPDDVQMRALTGVAV